VSLRLSPALDVPALHTAFRARRRLHIPGILDHDSAGALVAAMEAFDGWKVSVSAGGELFELPLRGRVAAEPGKQGWIDGARVDGAESRMQYIFDTRRLDLEPEADDIVTNFQRKAVEAGHPLHYMRYRKHP
jgi:hypothetical protein